MPIREKRKQQTTPRRKGKIEAVQVNESTSGFITLRLSPEASERLLRTSDPIFLRWVARNTLLATQAQRIRDRFQLGDSAEVDTTGEADRSPSGGTTGTSSVALLPPPDVYEGTSFVSGHSETPQSATRTPSLKLKFGGTPTATPGPSTTKSIPSTPAQDDTPNGSSKKRKRPAASVDLEQSGVGIPPARVLSLKLNTKQPVSSSKTSAITPSLVKLKTKGKIPKRPQGVGYDSELEDRELDPVILEAFVLRMLPGEDCDYIRDAITNGTIGIPISQGGPEIRLRFLDVGGRRGILTVRGRCYAFSIVDLPTITEGMKSWDKKNFIKSVDISQMCLVLGRCANDDEEIRNYPLPTDVNPKNYQYAHGLTAPMRNVRKRRFERTTRTRLDDIEAIERKVNSLLEADAKATDARWEILDRDPRQEEDEFSEDEYGSDEDAEGEQDGYFPIPGHTDTSQIQTPDIQYTQQDISALEAMFDDEDDDAAPPLLNAPPTSTAATATPADPTSSTAATPAADSTLDLDTSLPDADADAASPSDNDNDADNDADADASDEDSDHEASDEKAETLVKIKEAEEKIEQERKKLKGTGNHILKKKIATKITALENDIRMMRRHAGIGEAVDGGGEGSEED